MKNMQTIKRLLFFSLILLMAFISANTASAAWNNTTVDNSGNVGQYPSLAIDSQDNPHISYFDNSTYDLKYASYNGTQWNIETVDSNGQVGYYPSLALDSNDHPHISYIDYTNNALKYAAWDGTQWNIETIASVGTLGWDTDWTTSIALDSNNEYSHISYYHYTNQTLMYTYWNGTQWIICKGQGNIPGWGSDGRYSSLALTSDNLPLITTWNSNNYLIVYWNIEPTRSSSSSLNNELSFFTSLALNSDNQFNICYYSVADTALKYVRPYFWDIITIDNSGDVGQYNSLRLDSNEYSHISYQDATNLALKYAYWNGVKWQIQTLDDTVDVYYTSLALDSQGIPHIAYFDGTNTALNYISAIPTVFNTRTQKYFLTIQDAIDAVSTLEGDTITVGAGTYNEDVSVYKALTIIGESVTNTFVKSFNITNTGSGSDISGFSLTSGSGAAITLNDINNCKIYDNYISGGYTKGINLVNSDNNEIYGNIIDDALGQNNYGIYLEDSAGNTIGGTLTGEPNTITNCKYDGIYLNGSNYNTITGNNISENDRNGICLENCSVTSLKDGSTANNVIESNDIYQNNDGDTGYTAGIYLINSNYTYIHQNNVYQNLWLGIQAENSANTTIDDNQIYENQYDGISISTIDDGSNATSNNAQITNNNIHDNGWSGVNIFDSNNTTVENNSIQSNGHEGVYAYGASGFSIKNNSDISNNYGDGIALVYCSDFNITGNNILGNLENGIELDGSDNFHIIGNEIANNTNNGQYPWVGYGVSIEDCQDFEIYQNSIYGNYLNGLDIWNSINAIINDNELYSNQYAIYVYNDGTLEITNNSIHDNSLGGIYAEESQAISILENNIFNNQYGIYIQSTSDVMKINFNRIVNNSNGGLYCDNGTVNATLNWWGTNLSPVTKISMGTNGNVLFDPWLVLNANASPEIIHIGNSSMVTVDLQHDNHGNTYDPVLDGHIPDGITVTFQTDKGTIYPLSATITNGISTATFTGTALGKAAVTATVDDQPAYATIYTKENTKITVNNPAGKNGETIDITATLTNEDNTPLANREIMFNINGKSYIVRTGADGIATLSYLINLEPGTYLITAAFGGDDYYVNSTGTGVLTVEKTETTNGNTVHAATIVMQNTGTNPLPLILAVLAY